MLVLGLIVIALILLLVGLTLPITFWVGGMMTLSVYLLFVLGLSAMVIAPMLAGRVMSALAEVLVRLKKLWTGE